MEILNKILIKFQLSKRRGPELALASGIADPGLSNNCKFTPNTVNECSINRNVAINTVICFVLAYLCTVLLLLESQQLNVRFPILSILPFNPPLPVEGNIYDGSDICKS